MMTITEINEVIKEHQETSDCLDVKASSILMYQAFYEQHKQSHGSNKIYLCKGEYIDKMQERYDWIFCQMYNVLESRILYDRHSLTPSFPMENEK